jgi:hypothetical protein
VGLNPITIMLSMCTAGAATSRTDSATKISDQKNVIACSVVIVSMRREKL